MVVVKMKPEEYKALKMLTQEVNLQYTNFQKALALRDKMLKQCLFRVEEIHQMFLKELAKPDAIRELQAKFNAELVKIRHDISILSNNINILDERTIVLIEDIKFVDEPTEVGVPTTSIPVELPPLSDDVTITKRPLTENDLTSLGYNKLKKLCFQLGCTKYTEPKDFYIIWLKANSKFINKKIIFNPNTNKITIGV